MELTIARKDEVRSVNLYFDVINCPLAAQLSSTAMLYQSGQHTIIVLWNVVMLAPSLCPADQITSAPQLYLPALIL